jgi:hypothetical protein
MDFPFEWNPYADQPHNVAPKSERLRYHLKHAGSYLALAAANLRRAIPVLAFYRKYRKGLYKAPVALQNAVACSVSPGGDSEELLDLIGELGIRETLVRVPSWESERLAVYETLVGRLRDRGIGVCLALLQRRTDVLDPGAWISFLENVFSRFGGLCPCFEVGHAWNRTKWGLWDYREYLRLASPAFALAGKHGVKLVGPAVIDFEFHLYPATLPHLPFDKVSSLLYVDRKGAPENKQYGWATDRKVALLKAVVDASSKAGKDVWITEVNWPLQGTGLYSPASGRPNVTEEEQADFLVRYYVLCLATGLVERIYWWQLVAPGYGLIDSRLRPWRKRPSFQAFKTLREHIEDASFERKEDRPGTHIFRFSRRGKTFTICWTAGQPTNHIFDQPVTRILGRDGRELAVPSGAITLDRSPKYVFF